jgi:thymidylate synthase
MTQKDIWQDIYQTIHRNGKLVKPRGLTVLEVENFAYELPPYVRFPSFVPRNLKLGYIKDEFRWYLNGDPYDLSICDKASIWKNIVHKGRLNSNYGLYAFRMKGFNWVVEELGRDKDSRRAYITILDHTHLIAEAKDVPCTMCIGFRIRDNKLNMSVRMRSQDMVYGMGNDAPAFSFIHEMAHNALLVAYPELQLGTYHHVSDSAHIYERHFELLEKLVSPDVEFTEIEIPRIAGPLEVVALTTGTYPTTDFDFSKWLITSN